MVGYTLLIFATCWSAMMANRFEFNFNPASPEYIQSHIFMFGNGSIDIADGPNPFANNALDGVEFFSSHLNVTEPGKQRHRQDAIDFWKERFGVDGDELMANGDGIVMTYQIHPDVNERAYMMNTPCVTPPNGHEVIDGGFQLFVTNPSGIEVPDPITGESKTYPFQTNLVYSWLKIHVREAEEDCGVTNPPPEWIVLRYQTFEPAKWTTNAIVFELEVIGVNYFGSGRSLGISAPIVTETTITNRLLNYITFESAGPVDFVDYLPVTQPTFELSGYNESERAFQNESTTMAEMVEVKPVKEIKEKFKEKESIENERKSKKDAFKDFKIKKDRKN